VQRPNVRLEGPVDLLKRPHVAVAVHGQELEHPGQGPPHLLCDHARRQAERRVQVMTHLSPISLARFEENAGRTNTSLVRLEGHAAYGVERTAAATRIACETFAGEAVVGEDPLPPFHPSCTCVASAA
jgi:hypothetical protein